MSIAPIEAVVFDVNETLFSLDRLRPVFSSAGLEPRLVDLWFAGLLRDGFALAALGGYRPFAEVAAQCLRGLDARVDDALVSAVTETMRELEPHPDVAPALEALRRIGIPAATLTNGGTENVRAMLKRAGLEEYFTANLSVDAVRRWKPAPEPYRYAATELGVAPGSLALIAVHPWDCAGAAVAGLRSAWVQRAAATWPAIFQPPEFSAPDLTALVEALPR